MKLNKRPGKNEGFYINLVIGKKENESWWGAPPENIDHVDLSYLRDRYPLISTEKRAVKFKELWKELWNKKLSKEDIEFLKSLQNEMNTQDTCCQADPRFWVVMQTKRIYGIAEDYGATGQLIVGNDGEEIEDNINALYEFLHDDLDIDCYLDRISGTDKSVINIEEKILEDIEDVMNFIEEYTSYDQYSLVSYMDVEQIVEDTMFITLRECEKHIQANSYHYKRPIPYAMTAWRSPQVERLYKILQETKWDESEVE